MTRGTSIGMVVILALAGAAAAYVVFTSEIAPEEPEPELAFWPLTGEVAPDGEAIRARAISVKIENSAAARPQVGLAEADVVYETLSEGGIPRFNAIFHSSVPERLGPIRSARLSDVYLVPQYGALFAHSGVSALVRDRIAAAGIDDIGMERRPGPYARDPGRSAPHNVYAGGAELVATAVDAGFPTEGGPGELLFGAVPTAAGETTPQAPPATSATIPFSGGNTARWTWDAGTSRWLRDVGGQPHIDEGGTERYSAANVVIMFVEIRDSGMRDAAGSVVLDIRLDGAGDAVVLRDGLRYDVRWTALGDAPPSFETADGTAFPLATGKTWIEAVPLEQGVVIE